MHPQARVSSGRGGRAWQLEHLSRKVGDKAALRASLGPEPSAEATDGHTRPDPMPVLFSWLPHSPPVTPAPVLLSACCCPSQMTQPFVIFSPSPGGRISVAL